MLLIPVLAAPLGCVLAFGRFRGKSVLDAVITLPMIMLPTVLGFALLVVIGPHGVAGSTWEDLTGGRLVFSFAGIRFA